MEHALLQHQKVGDSFSGTYYTEQAYVKQTAQGKDYTDLVLRDRSGSRNVKFWGTVKGLNRGTWVFVACRVEDYQGAPSVIAKNAEVADVPTDLSEYIPQVGDAPKNAQRFDEIRETLKVHETAADDYIVGMIVDEVFGNAKFFGKFVDGPSNTGSSYGRRGGLLANTVRVATACEKKSELYSFEPVEKAILLGAALLCRVGAVEGFAFEDCIPTQTKEGMLLGIESLTMTRVSSAYKRIVANLKTNGTAFNQETVIRLLHAISAYSGKIDPMTKEAMLLHSEYSTDATLAASIDFIQQDVNEGEEFTAFDPAMKRRYFRG